MMNPLVCLINPSPQLDDLRMILSDGMRIPVIVQTEAGLEDSFLRLGQQKALLEKAMHRDFDICFGIVDPPCPDHRVYSMIRYVLDHPIAPKTVYGRLTTDDCDMMLDHRMFACDGWTFNRICEWSYLSPFEPDWLSRLSTYKRFSYLLHSYRVQMVGILNEVGGLCVNDGDEQ